MIIDYATPTTKRHFVEWYGFECCGRGDSSRVSNYLNLGVMKKQ